MAFEPVQLPEATQVLAFNEDQVNVTLVPVATTAADAEMLTVGVAGVGVELPPPDVPPPPPPQAETRSPSDAISTSAVSSFFMALHSLVVCGSYRPRFGAVRHDATQSRMRGNRCLRCGKFADSGLAR